MVRLASRRTWGDLATEALTFPTAREVADFMDRELSRYFPEIFGQAG